MNDYAPTPSERGACPGYPRRVGICSALTLTIASTFLSINAWGDLGFGWDTENKGGSGSWFDSDHWTPKGIPGTQDSANTFVTINAPSTGLEESSVSLPCCLSIAINSLTLGPRTSPLPTDVVGTNSLTVQQSAALGFLRSPANPSPAIHNSGLIYVYGVLGSGIGELDRTTLSGPGRILLFHSGQHLIGQFESQQTIEGEGDIMGVMVNRASIRAAHGGTLRLYASVDNDGGMLTTDGAAADPFRSVLLIGSRVTGGVIDANGGGVRFATSEALKGVTLIGGPMGVEWPGLRFEGANQLQTNAVLSAAGIGVQPGLSPVTVTLADQARLTNNGVVRLETSENRLGILDKSSSIGSTATLGGTGRVILNGSRSSVDIGPLSELIQETDHTIEGFGQIMGGTLRNEGRVAAKGGTMKLAAFIRNAGSLESAASGVLELTSSAIISRSSAAPNLLSPGAGVIRLTGATVADGEWAEGRVELYPLLSGSSPAVILTGTHHFSSNAVVEFVTGTSGLGAGIAVIPGSYVIRNDGTIRLNGAAMLYSGDRSGVSVTSALLTGSGRLLLVPTASARPSLTTYASSGFVNDTYHTIQGAGTLNAPIENRGTIIVEDGYLALNRPVAGSGTLRLKASGKLALGPGLHTGSLLMEDGALLDNNYSGTVIEIEGNLSFAQTNEASWHRGNPSFLMCGGHGVQRLEIGGTDLGATWSGFSTPNFQLQKLIVQGDGTRVVLTDSINNGNRSSSSEALYATTLTVLPGATLNLNGRVIYSVLTGTPHRVIAGEGDLFGGGQIVDLPEAEMVALSVARVPLGNSHVWVVSWPSPAEGWVLQENTSTIQSAVWSNVAGPIQDDGIRRSVVIHPVGVSKFYQLIR
ncbi:MAG: hypothetical protein JNN07_03770 [Verrucomicrobiales bacterium]|nr:hypothetical protein [Verrucomicrobiales bacterium]